MSTKMITGEQKSHVVENKLLLRNFPNKLSGEIGDSSDIWEVGLPADILTKILFTQLHVIRDYNHRIKFGLRKGDRVS